MKHALIVAGGLGNRISKIYPKQFMLLQGKPILWHAIQAFHNYSNDVNIVIVLAKRNYEEWSALCKVHNINTPVQIVEGGSTRFHSVKNGLLAIKGKGLVAIHDAARPLVSQHIIESSYHIASQHQSAIASVSLKDSIRKITKQKNQSVDRKNYKIIQTPQTFDLKLIKKAYFDYKKRFLPTDDASVIENAGIIPQLFEGSHDNIKITNPEDITIAEALLQQRNRN